MPADYKSRGQRREKKRLPGFVWLLAGLAIGLFVAFLVYLDAQPRTSNDFTTAVQQELEKIKPARQAKTETPKKDTARQEPKFNFYTILPELEVLIPDAETRPPENKQEQSVVSGNRGKQYILQAGSFRGQDDADRLKASLALLGFEASVQKVTINNEAWHRVRLGPYANTRDLYRNINLLQEHDINAMAMELKQE